MLVRLKPSGPHGMHELAVHGPTLDPAAGVDIGKGFHPPFWLIVLQPCYAFIRH